MNHLLLRALGIFVFFGCVACTQSPPVMDLSGKWTVRIDSARQYTVQLPGSLTENGVGLAVTDSSTTMLSEPLRYAGEATYTKEVDVPQSWEGKPVELYMERTKVSKVFINDSLIGTCNSVSAPHIYIFPKGLKAGRNQLKIMINNAKALLPLGGSHAYSEHTQTNWNGILGDFYLKCLNWIDLRNLRVDTSTDGLCVLSFQLLNSSNHTAQDEKFTIIVRDTSGTIVLKQPVNTNVAPGWSKFQTHFQIQKPQLWDEYTPYLYTLQVENVDGEAQEVKFGIRDFKVNHRQLSNNGRTIFLRGKHEGGVFPLTGYPSMKKEDWLRYFRIAKSWGINHVRYHSWTPPGAAFEAADETGVFIQSELPLWGKYSCNDTVLIDYMKTEGERIMETYGNHPSFVMFALGNELSGDTIPMDAVVSHLRGVDNRRLYAMGSNNFFWDTHTYSCEDFFVSMRNGKIAADFHTDLRGSFSFANSEGGGLINSLKPNTNRDFSLALQGLEKPVIGHETGQYQIFPDFSEIDKYTGVLQPRNLEVIRKRTDKAGFSGQTDEFLKASGALSALCYREEVEMALRTQDFSGFQLLDLEDYPGQGTSLVGILNVFMESKNVIEQSKWKEFCNDIVPLARFPKYCWTTVDEFTADIEIAHYGKEDLVNKQVLCILKTADNKKLYEEIFLTTLIKQGQVNSIASVKIPLNGIDRNQQLSFSIEIKGTDYRNAWDIWAYAPGTVAIREGEVKGVLVTRDERVYDRYRKEGKKVFYIPRHTDIEDRSVGGLFITDFWNYASFKKTAIRMKKEPSPGTFGLLMEPSHGVFKIFPTGFHTNWQWWSLVKHSRPMILDAYPEEYRPIVQVIDNWDRNHKLGLIFECPDSKGNAIVCASDLFACKENPEAQALFESIIQYISGL